MSFLVTIYEKNFGEEVISCQETFQNTQNGEGMPEMRCWVWGLCAGKDAGLRDRDGLISV